MIKRFVIVLLALALVLVLPFVLRPENRVRSSGVHAADVITIITPHNETIQKEIGQGFRRHMLKTEDREVVVEWRSLGGTSEIEKFLDTAYTYAFRRYWESDLGNAWTGWDIAGLFQNRKAVLPEDSREDTPGLAARRAFLESNVGVGIDLFFGGGPYPFVVHAGKGHLVDSGIADVQPELFTDEVIPATFSGESYYDPEFRWVGSCLSSFGIVYNHDSLDRLGIDAENLGWTDMGRPELFQQVALADPSKSGSVTKAFEMLLQQSMREALQRDPANPNAALETGWLEGMKLVQRICANARYFSNKSPEIALDVAQGNAAMGMCIDFFGRTTDEQNRREGKLPRVGYVTPTGGSSVSIDPIAMLRGGPNPELARSFIAFVLSLEGQKLWNYRTGTPDGPTRVALRRLPIRRDLYTPRHLQYFSDPDEMPYETGRAFTYKPEWTASAFGSIRFLIRSCFIDAHDELREAWRALIENGFPAEAMADFERLETIGYAKALGDINNTLRTGDPIAEITLARNLTVEFRQRYRHVARTTRKHSLTHRP